MDDNYTLEFCYTSPMSAPAYLPHQLTENVKILQKACLVHNGEVLLLRRPLDDASRPGCWDCPGGNSEWPVSVTEPTANLHQQDIAREVQEETGLDLDPSRFDLDSLAYIETFFEPHRQVFTVLFGWWVPMPDTFDRTTVRLSDEHTELAWTTFAQAQTFDFGGERGSFMNRILAGAAHRSGLPD